VVYNQREALLRLMALPPPALAAEMSQLLLWTTLKIGAALLVLAILDYGYQWWRHEQDLKMTPQELREELKNIEGDPQLRARRKQMQRDLAIGRTPPAESPPAETQADGLKK
jgi:flagellar biosynthesis protein FlhB